MKKSLAILAILASTSAVADTTNYEFTGNWLTNGGSLGYSGSFSLVDPAEVQRTVDGLQWEGISIDYSGGSNFNLTFANGASAHADTFDIRVNNTTQIEAGTPFPLGLSAQFYPRGTIITAGMSADKICATNPCGPDDDPIYRRGDSFESAVKGITGFYMAYYRAPVQSIPTMPRFDNDFEGRGLGIYTTAPGGNTTTLSDLSTISATIAPVPEPETYAMMLVGLLAILFVNKRRIKA